MNENPTVSIISVIYHDESDVIGKMLESILKNKCESYEIVLVNNKIENNNSIKKYFAFDKSKIRIINSNYNFGFAKGCNIGAKISRGKFLLFLNPDAIVTPTMIQDFLRRYEDLTHDFGTDKILFSPRINVISGNHIFFKGIVNFMGFAFPDSYQMNIRINEPSDFVSGSCFFIKKEHFIMLGMFKESYFMYHEDVELSIRARINGFKVFVLNDLSVIHLKKDEDFALNPFKYYYLERNRIWTFLTYSQNFWRSFILISFFEPILFCHALINKGFLQMRFQIWAFIFLNFRKIFYERPRNQNQRIFYKNRFDGMMFFMNNGGFYNLLKWTLSFLLKISRNVVKS